jgi:peptide/nickel transport system substrate-binding protein
MKMSKKKRIILIATMILILITIAIGCKTTTTSTVPMASSTVPVTTTTTTTVPPATTPQYGGTLKIIVPPGVGNIGYPGKMGLPNDGDLNRPACETLLGFSPTQKGKYIPQLATDWQYSPDLKYITMTLRKGVKFQDGTDFNASATKINLDLWRLGSATLLASIDSIDIIDEYTIRINLKYFDANILVGFASPSGWMVSPTSLKTLGDEAILHPVGTGAFKFVSYQKDVSLKFEKWDGYWQKGKPYLDGIEWVFIKDPVTRLASFKAGEAQLLREVLPKDVADLQATGKYTLYKYPSRVSGMAGDSAHPSSPFANLKLRQAISYAIDGAAVAKAVGFGAYATTNQFARPDAIQYNPNIAGYPYNVNKAKQLLAEAGYSSGFETKITFDATDSDQVAMFSIVQSYLSDVGIKATLDAADPARYNEVASKGWNNQLVWFWTAASFTTSPIGCIKAYISEVAYRYDTKSILRTAEYDKKYAEASGTPDMDKIVAGFKELGKMIIDDYCLATPIMVPYTFKASTNNVHADYREYAQGEWLPEDAWLGK